MVSGRRRPAAGEAAQRQAGSCGVIFLPLKHFGERIGKPDRIGQGSLRVSDGEI